ncbi:MAG: hypothetical protein P8Y70_14165 [Candidatus Lokiarchaeota archaeon]
MLIRIFRKEGKFCLHIIKNEDEVLPKEYKIKHLEENRVLDPILLTIFNKLKAEVF